MSLIPPGGRTPSLLRRWSKFGYFLGRGNSPTTAWWLAVHDAPKHGDFRGASLAALAGAYAADPSWADLEAVKRTVRSRSLDLEFTGQASDASYPVWRELAGRGWRFKRSGEALAAENGTLRLHLFTTEEAEMCREIFYDECYDFLPDGEWEVVDIGANVGMAALHFASQPWVRRVHAFEPFPPTADSCEKNLRLNPRWAEKIALHRVGLGETEETLTVDYHPALRGSMTLQGVGAWRGEGARPAGIATEIKVRPAGAALAGIVANRGRRRLLAKIDCEGSEYAILRNLHATGLLDAFSAFVIEWHGRGPDELTEILTGRGFAVQLRPLSTDRVSLGLLRAYRLGEPGESGRA